MVTNHVLVVVGDRELSRREARLGTPIAIRIFSDEFHIVVHFYAALADSA